MFSKTASSTENGLQDTESKICFNSFIISFYHHFQLFTKATVKPAAIEAVNGIPIDVKSSNLSYLVKMERKSM